MTDYKIGEKAQLEAKAKKADQAAAPVEYNTSGAGLGAYAAKMAAKARPTPRATPDAAATATPAPLTITTPHDLGGTPISPGPGPQKRTNSMKKSKTMAYKGSKVVNSPFSDKVAVKKK